MVLGFRVWGLGFGGLVFWVWGLVFWVWVRLSGVCRVTFGPYEAHTGYALWLIRVFCEMPMLCVGFGLRYCYCPWPKW